MKRTGPHGFADVLQSYICFQIVLLGGKVIYIRYVKVLRFFMITFVYNFNLFGDSVPLGPASIHRTTYLIGDIVVFVFVVFTSNHTTIVIIIITVPFYAVGCMPGCNALLFRDCVRLSWKSWDTEEYCIFIGFPVCYLTCLMDPVLSVATKSQKKVWKISENLRACITPTQAPSSKLLVLENWAMSPVRWEICLLIMNLSSYEIPH